MATGKKTRRKIPDRHSLENRAAKSIEAAFGGRQALIDTLSDVDLDPEQLRLFAVIADPQNDARALSTICAEHGYKLGHVLQLFKDARLAKAQLAAITRVTDSIPLVAEDLMKLAVIRKAPCPNCEGEKFLTVEEPARRPAVDKHNADDVARPPEAPPVSSKRIPCVICRATGEIDVEPDLKRQEIALEIAGVYKRGGGLQVGVQVNNLPALESSKLGASVTPQDLSRIRVGTDRLLYPSRANGDTSDVVDVEVVAEVEEKRSSGETIEPRSPVTLDPGDLVDPVDRSGSSEPLAAPVALLNGRPFLPPAGRRA